MSAPGSGPADALAALQGEWAMVFASRDGQPLSAEFVATGRRVVRGRTVTEFFRGQAFMQGTLTADDSQAPMTLDVLLTSPPGRGRRLLGLYEFDGDRLRICVGAPGRDRPAGFEAALGSDHTLTLWRPLAP